MGNTGLFSTCGGNLGFHLELGRGSWAPLNCMKGIQTPLEFCEGTQDCSRGAAGEKGLILIDRGISWFVWIVAGGLVFLSRCHGEIREPLVLPQESQFSIRIVRVSPGVLWSHGRGIRHHFAWKGESPCVSRVWPECRFPPVSTAT